jgi:uncharacterized RDD family membrane protein YckC
VTKEEQVNNTKLNIVGLQGRMFATIIDLFLSMLILLPFAEASFSPPPEVQNIIDQLRSGVITQSEAIILYFSILTSEMAPKFIISGVVVVLFWIYKSGTPGKIFLKMRIVDADTLTPPSKIKLIIRYFGYIVASIPLFIGFFSISWNKQHQGWHDKMANTIVIYDGEQPTKRFFVAFIAMIITIFILMMLGI